MVKAKWALPSAISWGSNQVSKSALAAQSSKISGISSGSVKTTSYLLLELNVGDDQTAHQSQRLSQWQFPGLVTNHFS